MSPIKRLPRRYREDHSGYSARTPCTERPYQRQSNGESMTSGMGIDLYWLPLGAGGYFVRLNGRIYEALKASLERRRPLDLYHTALVVSVPEGRFVIENAWPIPDAHGPSRGVVVEGPVGSRRFQRFRVLRYEIRRWRDGSSRMPTRQLQARSA
jgi:hypothetical protein